MSDVWFKNFIGIHQSDYQLLAVKRPRIEYIIHITFKSIQTGALVGSILGPTICALRGGGDGRNNFADLKSAAINGGWMGAGAGLLVGPLIGSLTAGNMSSARIYDRCYRLRFNRPHLLIDRLFTIGAIVGLAVDGRRGFVIGVDTALVTSALLNSIWKR